MFKENDYIVLLDTPITDSAFPPNYIFKQRSQSEYLFVELDCNLKKNGWLSVEWDLSKSKYQWRYATIEEIEYYDLHNKPYDVTTLSEFKLPDKWHILLTDKNYKDVTEWRFTDGKPGESSHWNVNHTIAGMDGGLYKAHNPSDKLKSDTYDFGIEITYSQFKKHVLKQENEIQDYDYLIEVLTNKNII